MSHINQNHCINPDCQRPYPQPWGNKFCHNCGSPLQLLDRYVPLQRLGSGGFAQIYTVWDQKTQTEKVLKVLVEASPKALELFAQEAAVLRNLRHPGVPKVDVDGYFQINLTNPKPRQLPCLVMEKINGQTLEEVFQQYPQGCPQELVLNWFAQAVEILQELHRCKIIHRDIKPSNLMLRNDKHSGLLSAQGDQLVLIDFGGAKQFSSSLFLRSPNSTRLYSSGYSPPEQIVGGNVGPGADFYALGRTMIEMLTGKSLLDLEDPLSGELQWQIGMNVNPQLAYLLDEMVNSDVRSRPANTDIIQKRLTKISQKSRNLGFFSQVEQFVRHRFAFALGFLSQVGNSIGHALANSTQTLGKTILFILKAIVKVFLACLDTIWTMFLTGIGASFGAIAGFIMAYQTNLDERVAEFLSRQLPILFPDTHTVLGPEILLFAGAGLGTAWGLTLAGGFGQRRRFLVASLMGITAYGFGWLVLQLITPKDEGEGLIGLILAAVSLLTLGLGLRSHQIVHAVIAAFGTAIVFAILVILGFPTDVFNLFSSPHRTPLWLPVAFFGFVGVFLSFWLGVSYYLIVPGLRFLGWR